MASFRAVEMTTTSIRIQFILDLPFQYFNYVEAGVTNVPFTDGAQSLPTSAISKAVVTNPDQEIATTSIELTVTQWVHNGQMVAIQAGHTYNFYGYVRKASDGRYYKVSGTSDNLLTVRTPSPSNYATAPYDLVCQKRREVNGLFYLDFSITVPNDTEELIVEISTSNSTDAYGNFIGDYRRRQRALSEFSNISGNTYAFSFTADELTTYYIHAAVIQRTQTGGQSLSNWCGTETVSTPLSNSWLSDSRIAAGPNSDTYFTCYLQRNQWNSVVNGNYFSFIDFEFYYNGSPVVITHKRLGSSFTTLSNPVYTARFTATEIDSLPNQRNGFASLLPSTSATLTAYVRIYSYINGVYLQPVDTDGSDYVGIFTYNYSIQTIDNFYWTASNGSASAQQTQTAYSVINNNGTVSQFSYLVWNDIVDKVKEVLDTLGYSWDTTYSTYANAKMSASDKYLTAVRFNSVRNNIGIHYATGISTKLIGDYVYGSDILLLVSKLNSWIDTL